MKVENFLQLIADLTGIKGPAPDAEDLELLAKLVEADDRLVDVSQLNELLLLTNSSRVSRTFFTRFFGEECQIGCLEDGVRKFRVAAMLHFGNFIYAFDNLSKATTPQALSRLLGEEHGVDQATLVERFRARRPPLAVITPIPRDETYILGYIAARDLSDDAFRRDALLRALEAATEAGGPPDHASLAASLRSNVKREMAEPLVRALEKRDLSELSEILDDAGLALHDKQARSRQVRDAGRANERNYLTWDHIDVYFATSMRRRHEFEELFDFVHALLSQPKLADLHLRCFDPTQSYTKNRVDKGLVEALMLRRAKCTVYSVQDTDTLGKDSELAATLAQGKPVIAYVPEVRVGSRAGELCSLPIDLLMERLRFVNYADDQFRHERGKRHSEMFRKLREEAQQAEGARLWLSEPMQPASSLASDELLEVCEMIAKAEARILDKRARFLSSSHPLALQVNLATGVANGVLVVRDVDQCAEVLYRVLTNSLEFTIREKLIDSDDESEMWYLVERLTGSAYRVVTKDPKLTNCFWNFYPRAGETKKEDR